MKKLLLFSALLIGSFTVNAQCAIVYVTPEGEATSAGTLDDPKSIEEAFSSAVEGTLIRLSTGVYEIEAPLVLSTNNLVVEGGFLANESWTKTSLPEATTILRKAISPEGEVNQQRLVAMMAVDKSGFEFHDVTIRTEDAFEPGMSTYGVYLSGCDNYKFVRCVVEAGNAADGRSGDNGEPGFTGSVGLNGGAGDCDGGDCTFGSGDAGGAGGNGGAGSSGLVGGAGGAATNGSQDNGLNGTAAAGRDGGSGAGGGAGGDECTSNNGGVGGVGGDSDCASGAAGGDRGNDGNPGTSGANGSDGTNGAAGINGAVGTLGMEIDGFWIPGGPGEVGTDGCGGAGAGGGGGGGRQTCPIFCDNGPGNGGGGGGGGGQGGVGGTGGYGGGSSFGVYARANGLTASFIDCNISVGQAGLGGQGGQGGQGGAGGQGGLGGTTCIDQVGKGGDGGKGGNGGNGGNGGSGQMGMASAVELSSGEAFTVLSTNFNIFAQPEIRLSYEECSGSGVNVTVQNMDLAEGDDVTSWTFGASASPTTGTANPQSVSFQNTGFFNIVNATNTYRGFAYYCCGTFASIDEENLDGISIYPNPNDGKVTIALPNVIGEIHVSVVDYAGRTVFEQEFHNTQEETIYIDGASGNYLLIVKTAKEVKSYKLIKN